MKFDSAAFLDEAQSLLERAAEPALQQIRTDRLRVTTRLKPLLTYLENHLFDPALNVSNLKRACGIRDNSIAILFHAEVGSSPKSYISDRRLETAGALLRESDLRVWQIGELIGYSSLGVFSKAFNRWAGKRPKVYRNEAEARAGATSIERFRPSLDPETLRRALDGELESDEAAPLIRRLLELYPGSAGEGV